MPEKFNANGYQTVLPDGWADRSVISLVDLKAASGFAANVVILREEVAENADIAEYAREQIALIGAGISDFQLLDERAATIHGNPAYELLQRFVVNNRSIQQAQTYILHGNTVFAVTCTAPVEEFNRSIPAFRAVMDNLSFDEQD